jgi:hypothetical protein
VNSTHPVLLYRTANSIEAKSLALHLEAAGVEARLTGETLYEAYAGLGLGQTTPVEVWISRDDCSAAMPLVNAWRGEFSGESKKARPGKFQFSLISVFLLMTFVAAFAGIMALP